MFTPSTITVSDGAYGQKYATAEDILAAWNAGKDFRNRSMMPGSYVSKRDIVEYAPEANIKIRFNGDADFVMINAPITDADSHAVSDE